MTNPLEKARPDLTAPNYAEELVMLGATGAMSYAPYGADIPKLMADYKKPWVDLGWLADSGLEESVEQEVNEWKAWQRQDNVRRHVASEEFRFNITLWSIGGLSTAMQYNVGLDDMEYDEESGVTSFVQGDKPVKQRFFNAGFDVIDGERARRFVLPRATIVEPPTVTYSKGDLVGIPLTIASTFDSKSGFSILREFREGWKPGAAGTLFSGAGKVADFGDWSGDINATSENAKGELNPTE